MLLLWRGNAAQKKPDIFFAKIVRAENFSVVEIENFVAYGFRIGIVGKASPKLVGEFDQVSQLAV